MKERLKGYATKVIDYMIAPLPTYTIYLLLALILMNNYQTQQRDIKLAEYIGENRKELVTHQKYFITQLELDSAWNEEFNELQEFRFLTIKQLLILNDKFSEDSVIYKTVYFNPITDSIPVCRH